MNRRHVFVDLLTVSGILLKMQASPNTARGTTLTFGKVGDMTLHISAILG